MSASLPKSIEPYVRSFVARKRAYALLKAMGVAYAQGFGVYQPHPIDSLRAP